MFFQALSLAADVWAKYFPARGQAEGQRGAENHPTGGARAFGTGVAEEVAGVAMLMKYFKRRIEYWQAVTDVNYLA